MVNRILFFAFFCCLFSQHVVANLMIIDPGPCAPDCRAVLCPKPTCKGGIASDKCICCPFCAKQEGEECGLPTYIKGKCDEQLYCKIRQGSNTGICERCPLIKCSKEAVKKCNGKFKKDNRGCNTCDCGCSYNGISFKPGETTYQQCNLCTCGTNGIWACTEKACPTGFCYFLGNQVTNGQSFFDGCNQCTCGVITKTQYGVIACTKRFCIGNCPRIYCPKTCTDGYQADKNNCPTCICKIKCISKCDTLVCAGGSVRQFIDKNGCRQCVCNPITGLSCPLFPVVSGPGCGEETFNPCLPDQCKSDADCPVDKKCCASGGAAGSPLACITPVPFPAKK